ALHQLAGPAVVDVDLRSPAWTGPADNIGRAVVVDVADRHPNTTAEGGRKGEEIELERARGGIVDVDLGQSARVSADCEEVWPLADREGQYGGVVRRVGMGREAGYYGRDG